MSTAPVCGARGGGWPRRLATGAALVALCGVLASCATWLPRQASEEEQRAFARAEAALERDAAAGREAFLAFLERFPEGVLAPEAELALGELAHREGRLDEAARRYTRVMETGGTPGDRARVRLASLELERGRLDRAREFLARARLSRLDADDLRTAYRALADTAAGPVERVRWLALLRGELDEEAEANAVDVEIDALLAELDLPALERVVRLLGDRVPAGRVHITRTERALDAGDLDAAREALEAARSAPLAPRYATRLAAVSSRVRAREAGPTDISQLPTFQEVIERPYPDVSAARGTLGVAVPLSGPFARFGEEALQGVLLAARVFSAGGQDGEAVGQAGDGATPAPRIRVVVRDSGGEAAQAAAAVRDLAADPELVAIVGPLVSKACEAAAREAEALGVPLLALTARERLARERPWAFRMRTRPVEEVQLLVDRARELGAERFAILYRDDPYGLGLRSLFWDAVEARGGRVVAVASYDPRATDFGEPIRRLVGYTLLDDEEKQLIAKREKMRDRAKRLPPEEALALREKARELTAADGHPIPPIVDFDALFIPDSHENVVLIAPQLAFHEVTGPRLLGTDGWYDEELLRLGREHVEGALFAAHYFPESPVPYVRDFHADFLDTFGVPPDSFAAEAFDAARIVLLQLARGREGREAVREGLLATEAYPGVSGILTMRSDGNAHKRPYLLGIERRKVVHYID